MIQGTGTLYGLQGSLKTISKHNSPWDLKIYSEKVEGTNNFIKTVRRKAYGYRNNEYFFLKIMVESRREYVRNS